MRTRRRNDSPKHGAPCRVRIHLSDAAQRRAVPLRVLWRGELGRLVAHQRSRSAIRPVQRSMCHSARPLAPRRHANPGCNAGVERAACAVGAACARRQAQPRRPRAPVQLRPRSVTASHARPSSLRLMPPEAMALPTGGIAVRCQELQVREPAALIRLPAPAFASRRRLLTWRARRCELGVVRRTARRVHVAAPGVSRRAVSPTQGLVAKLASESRASSAALLAGHDDCSRLQEHTALLSKQFSRAAMQARRCAARGQCTAADARRAGGGRTARHACHVEEQDRSAARGAAGGWCGAQGA